MVNSNTPAMSPEENALHRYYWWAFSMYRQFTSERDKHGMSPESWMYLSLWFALLYVTVEGWKALLLQDDSVSALLAESGYVRMLRRYRNGVAHFQRTYWDIRFDEMISTPETAPWAENLTQAFGAYFARRAIETNHPALAGKGETEKKDE